MPNLNYSTTLCKRSMGVHPDGSAEQAEHRGMADPTAHAQTVLSGAAQAERPINVQRVIDPWKKATHQVTSHIFKGLKTPEGKPAYPGHEYVRSTPGLRSGVNSRAPFPGHSIPSADVMPNRGAATALFLAHHATGGGLTEGLLQHARTRTSQTPPVSGTQFSPSDMPPMADTADPVNPWGGRPGSQPLL